MGKITYANKEAINVDVSIPNKNKVTADDMNEIKNSVNALYDAVVFSTNETLTSEVWVDGKSIYKKVYEITNISSITGTDYIIDITSLNPERVFIDCGHSHYDVEGESSGQVYEYQFDSNYYLTYGTTAQKNNTLGVSEINLNDELNNSSFTLHIGSNLKSVVEKIIVTIEYTKKSSSVAPLPDTPPPDDDTPEEEPGE